jgi:hypothetical protein
VILPSVLHGIALSVSFTPLTTAAPGYLRQDQMANAAGIDRLELLAAQEEVFVVREVVGDAHARIGMDDLAGRVFLG